MSKRIVLVTRRVPEAVTARLERDYEARLNREDRLLDGQEVLARAAGADALIPCPTDKLTAQFIDQLPASIRVIATFSVGYEHIDLAAAKRRGIVVTNTPEVLTDATADCTMLLLLGAARRAHEGERMIREATWTAWAPTGLLGVHVTGKRLGIYGMGRIGKAVARRARGFDMRVLYWSRQRKRDAEAALGIEWCELDDLLRRADFVSLHVALSPETRNLVGARELALMKADAVLVNTARGGVVDQAALVEALRSKTIAGAALDVFEVEPIPTDDPLLALDNVVVVPHLGSATVGTRKAMSDLAIDNLLAYFRGDRPPACINPVTLT